MVYADYDFYTTEYFGQTIQAEDFQRLALRASSYLDYCTQGRAKSDSRHHMELSMACCALAEQYAVIDTANAIAGKAVGDTLATSGGELQSESVGSWSQSYRSGGSTATEALTVAQNAQAMLANIVLQYLGPTGLLRARGRMA